MRAGLFAGQGVPAQQVLSSLPASHALLEEAESLLGFRLRQRVESEARRPKAPLPTLTAQPAAFVAGLIKFFAARDAGQEPDYVVGHSVGEYAALVAADSMSFADGLKLVAVRAGAMHRAARRAAGGMAAVLGLDLDAVSAIADRTGVTVANDNSFSEVVLSGTEQDLAAAAQLVQETRGRVVLLPVEGAFHSPAMAGAAHSLGEALGRTPIETPRIPVIANVTARPHSDPDEIRQQLVEQLTGRVRFRESIEWLWHQGVREFDDFGPGHVVGRLAEHTARRLEQEPVTSDV